jgi:L-amino acid N-acyltransferase YncA
VEILNYTIVDSTASFAAEPTDVADGPYRLLVARRGGTVLGYACGQPYRGHDAFRETVEVSVAVTEVGTFGDYAFKNGRYVSSTGMQRPAHPT